MKYSYIYMGVFLCLLLFTPNASAFRWCDWIPFWDCDDPIILTDHTIFNETSNVCSAERFNFGVSVYPCSVQDVDSKNIVQYVNFSYDGLNDKNGSLVFIYSGELENSKFELKRKRWINVSVPATVNDTIVLDNLTDYNNLGDVTLETVCDYGNNENEKVWEIEQNNNETYFNVCFNSKTVLDADSIEFNLYVDGRVNEEVQEDYYADLTHRVEFLGNNLNGEGYSYYKVTDQKFTAGKNYETKWTYTPKNKRRTGKWSIIAYQSETGLMNAIENDQYLFIDPWWNDSWRFRVEITNISGEYPSFNISYDVDMNEDFSDLRFLNSSENEELNFTLKSKVNNSWALVTVDTNNESSIYMYFGNNLASSTSNIEDTFHQPLNYYQLEDLSDSVGSNDFSNNNDALFVPGAIGDSINFSAGSSQYLSATEIDMGSSWSICSFVKITDVTSNHYYLGNGRKSGGDYEAQRLQLFGTEDYYRISSDMSSGSVNGDSDTLPITSNNVFYYVCVTRENGAAPKVYFNGGTPQTLSEGWSGTTTYEDPNLILGAYDNGGSITGHMNGGIDELVFYNRALTAGEVEELSSMQQRNVIFGSKQSAIILNVTLNSPPNNYKNNDGSILFNCSCLNPTGCVSLNMTIDGQLVSYTTNSTPTQNITLIYQNASIPDGDSYEWYCTGSSTSDITNSSTYEFNVDTILPTITVTEPLTSYGTLYDGDTLNLNYTISDDNIDTCWYSYNGSNTTINCSAGHTTFNYSAGYNNLTIYANDTYGNVNSLLRSWTVELLENENYYVNETLEGNINLFWVDVSTDEDIISANLVYNGTSYAGDLEETATGRFNVTRNLRAIDVDTATNNTFYWQFGLDTGSIATLRSYNQTVNPITVDNCSTNTVLFLNFSHLDEETQNYMNETNNSLEFDLTVYPVGETNSIIHYVSNSTGNNSPQVCLNVNLSENTYEYDLEVLYGGTLHEFEKYYLLRAVLSEDNIPRKVLLYDLLTADSTEFLITVKDEYFNYLSNAQIYINRKYVSEGVFKTVELPLTDENGNAVGHFDTDKGIYTLVIVKDGETLASFDNLAVICQDVLIGDCDLNLNLAGSDIPNTDYRNYGDVSTSWSFNEATRTVTVVYAVTDSSTPTFLLETVRNDAYGNLTVCNDTLTSGSGTLTCTVPESYGNITIVSKLYKDGTFLNQRVYSFAQYLSDVLEDNVYVFILILMMTIPLMFTTSTVMIVVGTILGLLISTLLMLFNTSDLFSSGSVFVWLIITGGIIIWKITKKEN